MARVLVADPIAADGVDLLQSQGELQVDVKTGMKPPELLTARELDALLAAFDGVLARADWER